jgi:P-type Ca2+ transporter type 2C
LSIAAVVSLALGLFQDFGTPRDPDDPPVDWVEGVAIIVAIVIVVSVGSVNDWQKERQFQVLNEKKEERNVLVIRGGEERLVDVKVRHHQIYSVQPSASLIHLWFNAGRCCWRYCCP